MLDGRVTGGRNRRKRAKPSPNMFLWRIYAAAVRPTPSELGDRSILASRQSQNQANPLGWSSRDRKIGDFEKKMRGIQQRLPSKQKSPAKVSPKPFLDIVLVGSKTRPCQNYLSHQKCSWFETFLGTKITIWDARNGYFSLWRSGSHRNQKWIPNQQPLWRRLTLPNPLLWRGLAHHRFMMQPPAVL